jgi:hypothetical protein
MAWFAFSEKKGCTVLIALVMVGSSLQISDVGVARLIHMPKLQRLGLGGTRITDKSLEHLRRLTSLKSVSIGRTAVSYEAIRKFNEALPDCEVIR